MTKKIEISRELAQNWLSYMLASDSPQLKIWASLLGSALAAPAVERQEPVAWLTGACVWTSKDAAQDHADDHGLTVEPLYTSQTAPVAVVLHDPIPITDGTARLTEACRLGEFSLEGGSPTVEAMSCASYDNNPIALQAHDFDSYAAGYQAAMYEEGKSLLGLIACLDKFKEMNK